MDVFVTKWDQNGNLIYSTFLGGKSRDKGLSIALDNNDNIYITGLTTSSDFPVTSNGYDQSYNGFDDIFVSILNNTGSSLIYSTFIGGSDWDNAYSLVIDEKLNMFLTGRTSSKDFPTTSTAYDQAYNGDNDAFVIKLNTSFLQFSTFLGGSARDAGSCIAIDKSGNIYVTGTTKENFPTSSGAFDETYNGNDDVFITKMNASGTSIIYSTYLGGSNIEEVLSLKVDENGNPYLTGSTSSPDFPAQKGSFDISFNEGVSDAFVCKIDHTGSNLVYSTFLGGNKEDVGISLTFDAAGNTYVTGYTSSENFPVTKKILDKTYNGKFDGFIVKLNPPGNSLAYSFFIGGDGDDTGDQITIDAQGLIYVTDYTESSNFPVSSNAYSKSPQGKKDAFILKISPKKK